MVTVTKNKNICNYLCLFGILSVALFAAYHIIGEKYYGRLYLPYDTIQLLAAVGSPSRFIALPLLLASRILGCLGCLAVCRVIKGRVNDDLYKGIAVYTALRIAVSVSELLFPTSIDDYGLYYGILVPLMVFLFLPLLLSYIVLVCIGTFQKNDNGKRNLLPGILLAVWLAPVIVLLVINIFSGDLTGILGGVETVFFYGTVIHGALLGVYGYALGKESSLSTNGEGKSV